MRVNNTFKISVLLLLFAGIFSCNHSKHSVADGNLRAKLEETMRLSKQQYEYFSTQIPDTLFPKTYQNAKHVYCRSWDWVSGFYPGTLLLLSKYFNDVPLYRLAEQKLNILEKEQFNKRTHDLGFMMFCSFGNALQIKPEQAYQEILLNSAKSLASRYNPVVKAIRSWDSAPQDFLVIIDNMMNLELLFWATKVSGDSSYYRIAVDHANTTLRDHFRKDYSTYHVVNYNPADGTVKEKKTHQGAFDQSSWARGQAWGLYGYTMMFKETGDHKYLDLAHEIASFILHHSSMPADGIPIWDFNAPAETSNFRDVSAAAIIASALIDLSKYSGSKSAGYMKKAEHILVSLISPAYFATYKTNGGFLLKHSVGHLPRNSEVDVPLTYADYYFIEAILRYLNLTKI